MAGEPEGDVRGTPGAGTEQPNLKTRKNPLRLEAFLGKKRVVQKKVSAKKKGSAKKRVIDGISYTQTTIKKYM